MTDYTLSDEILAISSIYGPDVLVQDPSATESSSSSPPSADCILRVPHSAGVELRLRFGPDYPLSSPPSVVAVVSSGRTTAQGHGKEVLELVRDVIAEKFVPEQPVMFEVLEALGELGELGGDDGRAEREGTAGKAGSGRENVTGAGVLGHPDGGEAVVGSSGVGDTVNGAEASGKSGAVDMVIEWIASDPATEKKSTFVAHACSISDAVEAKRNVSLLVASDRRFEKATHNISAFRGRLKTSPQDGARELVFQDCDDDGEDAAGGRLLHLLELTNAENVLVVVSRWYGGIKLGPDRFRIINQVAREALVRGGWVKEGTSGSKAGKKVR